LRQFGMGSLVDKAILSMNRAAEDAATGISSIFISSIKQMTVTDGLKILQGGDFAATDYLMKTTTAQLTEKMRPVIDSSLAKVNATTYWKDVFTAYNKISFSKQPVNTDLSSYVTEKAMTGIFYSIGQEEQKIRKDPAAQVTDLLKKVFSK
jgi:two-component SAPR family response regulator